MKTIDISDSIRRSAHANKTLVFLPGERTNRTWPLCLTCGRECDAAEIKNVNSTSCEIWASHHGAEDHYKVTWKLYPVSQGNDPLEDPNIGWAINRAIGDGCFFNPEHIVQDRVVLLK